MIKVMFQQLTDDETDDAARKDLVKFLKEMCSFSSTLQAADRDLFFQVVFPVHRTGFYSLSVFCVRYEMYIPECLHFFLNLFFI